MNESDVYLKAARAVSVTGICSCNAIYHPFLPINIGTARHRRKYRKAFGFASDLLLTGKWGLRSDRFLHTINTDPNPQNLRVWCLLMMAAACEDFE